MTTCLVYISATDALPYCVEGSTPCLNVIFISSFDGYSCVSLQFIEASTASLNILVCRLIGVYQTQIIGTFVGNLYL